VSVAKLVALECSGNSIDRSQVITDAIKQACYDHGEGASLALVIGCLEIAKAEILEENRE